MLDKAGLKDMIVQTELAFFTKAVELITDGVKWTQAALAIQNIDLNIFYNSSTMQVFPEVFRTLYYNHRQLMTGESKIIQFE